MEVILLRTHNINTKYLELLSLFFNIFSFSSIKFFRRFSIDYIFYFFKKFHYFNLDKGKANIAVILANLCLHTETVISIDVFAIIL